MRVGPHPHALPSLTLRILRFTACHLVKVREEPTPRAAARLAINYENTKVYGITAFVV
jgi:hypothetical protein